MLSVSPQVIRKSPQRPAPKIAASLAGRLARGQSSKGRECPLLICLLNRNAARIPDEKHVDTVAEVARSSGSRAACGRRARAEGPRMQAPSGVPLTSPTVSDRLFYTVVSSAIGLNAIGAASSPASCAPPPAPPATP